MTRPKRRRRWTWAFLVLLAAGAFFAVKSGWVGYGWAEVVSRAFPRDDALLAWAPSDTTELVLFDPHRARPAALKAGPSLVRNALERVRADIQKSTGVDLGFDVDRAMLTPATVVLRGRFDANSIADRLVEATYAKSFYNTRRLLSRKGEDSIMVEDDVLVYGDDESVKAAIDATGGPSLARNVAVVNRLAAIGWDAPLLGTVRLSDDRPSLREVIAGSRGPRAVTFAVRFAAGGVDVRASVETASAGDAVEWAERLERDRATAGESLAPATGPGLAALLSPALQGGSVHADESTAQVVLFLHISSASVDTILGAAVRSETLLARARSLRLAQLLSPPPAK